MTPETFEAERLKLAVSALRRLRAERITAWILLVMNGVFAIAHLYGRARLWWLMALSHILWECTIALWIATIRRREREVKQERETGEMLQRQLAAIIKRLCELRGIQSIVSPKEDSEGSQWLQ